MMFDFARFFKDHGMPYWTEGKNVSPGNVNIKCPFCSDKSNHMGGNPVTGQVSCWRCGSHSLKDLILSISVGDYKRVFERYGTKTKGGGQAQKQRREVAGKCKLPSTDTALNYRAGKYLQSRGYDPEKLVAEYGILSTGPVGRHKFRVIIPVHHDGDIVSFVGRDYTGKHPIRYLTATPEEEEIHHKNLLYAADDAVFDDVLVVEGITDVWRIGRGAVATFGTTFTAKQVWRLSEMKKAVWILFDAEPEAQQHAADLAEQLRLLGCRAERILLPPGVNDPGELHEDQVKKIRNAVFGE